MGDLLTVTQACGHTLTWRPWRAGEVGPYGYIIQPEDEEREIHAARDGECLACWAEEQRRERAERPLALPHVAGW